MSNSAKPAGGRGVFAGLTSFREAKAGELKPHADNVRTKVLPAIKEQLKKKEEGAERAKAYKVF